MEWMTLRYPIHDVAWIHQRCSELAERLCLSKRQWYEKEGDVVCSLSSAVPGDALGHVYLSAGLHGDEPAGVLALLLWLERSEKWRRLFRFDIFPCLNPWGLQRNLRTDALGVDLNRAYGQTEHEFITAHEKVIRTQGPYDLALLLHEDYDGQGCYLYEVTCAGQTWGPRLLEAAQEFCPVDPRELIEGRAAKEGTITRDIQAFASVFEFEAAQLFHSGCPRVFTVETPSELDLMRRAQAHLSMIEAALECLRESKQLGSPEENGQLG